MRSLFVIGLIATLSTRAFADDGDDTLRVYLSKSDVVLLGEFVSEPVGYTKEAGVVNYGAEFRIAELLKGEATKDRRAGGTIKVAIVRFEEAPEDHWPELRKGGKAILFLKSDARQGTHITTDVWFGIQRASPWMARSLARLAKEPAPEKDAGSCSTNIVAGGGEVHALRRGEVGVAAGPGAQGWPVRGMAVVLAIRSSRSHSFASPSTSKMSPAYAGRRFL